MCISRSLNKDLVSQNVLFNQNVIAFYRKLTRRKWSTPSVYPTVKKSVLGSFAKKIAEKLALLAKIAVLKFIKSKGHFLVMVKFTSSRRPFSLYLIFIKHFIVTYHFRKWSQHYFDHLHNEWQYAILSLFEGSLPFASSLGCGICTHFWAPLWSFCINLLAQPWGFAAFELPDKCSGQWAR